ncbi:Haloacetate dehalogenase H-2 [Edwardsiella tarda]|nr:Haloacetate dehalogenase H-2 [Edwardsiella tarda]
MRAAIAHHFTACFSVDELAAAFKPAPAVYRAVEQRLGLAGSALCLVACHHWDILGARSAGWQGAMLLRAGNAPLVVGPQPQFVAHDLAQLADQLISHVATPTSGGRCGGQIGTIKNASPGHSSAIASCHAPRQQPIRMPGSHAIQPSRPGRCMGSGAGSGISAAAA